MRGRVGQVVMLVMVFGGGGSLGTQGARGRIEGLVRGGRWVRVFRGGVWYVGLVGDRSSVGGVWVRGSVEREGRPVRCVGCLGFKRWGRLQRGWRSSRWGRGGRWARRVGLDVGAVGNVRTCQMWQGDLAKPRTCAHTLSCSDALTCQTPCAEVAPKRLTRPCPGKLPTPSELSRHPPRMRLLGHQDVGKLPVRGPSS